MIVFRGDEDPEDQFLAAVRVYVLDPNRPPVFGPVFDLTVGIEREESMILLPGEIAHVPDGNLVIDPGQEHDVLPGLDDDCGTCQYAVFSC